MNIQVPREQIESFCRRWKIREFALFGSVLRDDFRPDSDVDVLVTFDPDADHSWSEWLAMEDELKAIFGRDVDLVEKELIENPFIRRHVLNHHRIVYAADSQVAERACRSQRQEGARGDAEIAEKRGGMRAVLRVLRVSA